MSIHRIELTDELVPKRQDGDGSVDGAVDDRRRAEIGQRQMGMEVGVEEERAHRFGRRVEVVLGRELHVPSLPDALLWVSTVCGAFVGTVVACRDTRSTSRFRRRWC